MDDLREAWPERRWECLGALQSPLAEEWVRQHSGPTWAGPPPLQAHPGVRGSLVDEICSFFSLGFQKIVCFLDLDKNSVP